MNDDLRELYQEVIVDHSKKPRNFGKLDSASSHADGYNPLCGDQVTVYVEIDKDEGVVSDVSFKGCGCAISTASASVMTESVKGRPVGEVQAISDRFRHMVTKGADEDETNQLGKLEVFAGVNEFPSRVKCATLAWHTLEAAMRGDDENVTTE